ncbi:S26 family signal peptidase [Paraglaciecola hydrolytica]|uniref:Signal peptidase I n=1 Tax=Paraglaciecola hydrolytica TaxID=1799789 RepID=A0A148KMN9_9ALTE|nr:S26 family signal peptidase [Paraglaciecola hydrolytica]
MNAWIVQHLKDNLIFLLAILVLFASRSTLADWYIVPTGSMQPTIVEGDRILVNKMAYRIELPFTDIGLIDIATPQRGDIVVFNSKAADTRLVKRVIGLPGDNIAMVDNQLVINGQVITYQTNEDANAISELLAEKSHAVQFIHREQVIDNFNTVTVPTDHYLVLGDNRNNSSDSRVIGFVPFSEIQGKAHRVLVSLDPENYYLPRTSRTLSPLI